MKKSIFFRNLTAYASDIQISTAKNLGAQVDFLLAFKIDPENAKPEWLEDTFREIMNLRDYKDVYQQMTQRYPAAGIEPDVSFSVKLAVLLDKSRLETKVGQNTTPMDSETLTNGLNTEATATNENASLSSFNDYDTEVVTEPNFLSSTLIENSTEKEFTGESSFSHGEQSREKLFNSGSPSNRREGHATNTIVPGSGTCRANSSGTVSRSVDATRADVSQFGWELLHGRFALEKHDLNEIVQKLKEANHVSDPKRRRILLNEAKYLAKSNNLSKQTPAEKVHQLHRELSQLRGSGCKELKNAISNARHLVIRDPDGADKVLDDVYKTMKRCKYEPTKTRTIWTGSAIDQIEADIDELGWNSYSGHLPLDRKRLVAVLRKIKQAKDTNDLNLKKKYLADAKKIALTLNGSWRTNSNSSEGLSQQELVSNESRTMKLDKSKLPEEVEPNKSNLPEVVEPEKSNLPEDSLVEPEKSNLTEDSLVEPEKSNLTEDSFVEPEKSNLTEDSLVEPEKSKQVEASLEKLDKLKLNLIGQEKLESSQRSGEEKRTEASNQIQKDELTRDKGAIKGDNTLTHGASSKISSLSKRKNESASPDTSSSSPRKMKRATSKISSFSQRQNKKHTSQASAVASSYFDPTSDEYISEYEPEVYYQFLQRPPTLDEALKNLIPEDQLRFSKYERELRWKDEQDYRDIVETAKKKGTDPLETHGQIMSTMKDFTNERLEGFARKLQEERKIREEAERKQLKIKPKLGDWATVGEIRAAMTPEERSRKRLEEEAYFRREHEYLQKLKAREEEERARRYVPAAPAKTKSIIKKSTKGLTYKDIQESKTKEQLETERRNLDAERRRMSEHFARVRAQDEEAFRARFPWKYRDAANHGKGRVSRLAKMFEKGKRFSKIGDDTDEEQSESRQGSRNGQIQSKRSLSNSESPNTSKKLKGTPQSRASETTKVASPRVLGRRHSTDDGTNRLGFISNASKPVFPKPPLADRHELPRRRYSDGTVAKRGTMRLGSAPDPLQKSRTLFDTPVSWGELDDEDEAFLWNSDDFSNGASDESVFEDDTRPRSGSGGTPSRRLSGRPSSDKPTSKCKPIESLVPRHPGEDTILESETKLNEKTKSHEPKLSINSTPKKGRRRRLADPGLSFVDWRKAQSTLEEDEFPGLDEYSMFWGL